MKRRIAFAAPFVVIACGGSQKPDFSETNAEAVARANAEEAVARPAREREQQAEAERARERERAAQLELDRRIQEDIRAGRTTYNPPRPSPKLAEACHTGRTECHPARQPPAQPKPPACGTDGRTCNPPPPREPEPVPLRPVIARILGVRIDGSASEIAFAWGKDHGVTDAWTVQLATEEGVPVAGGACKLVRVDRAISRCLAHRTEITSIRWVRVEPPSTK